ncbi:MAG: stage II sporulation protein M [Candidatus Altiarchaeota archaeon]|nr:stage II sporulation protein M [Candidatus Altiarchaeota archaeon]
MKNILRKNLPLLVLSLLFFASGIPAGFLLYEDAKGTLQPVIEEIGGLVMGESKLDTAVNIFMNNLQVSLMLLVAGTLIIPSILILCGNGFVTGYIIKGVLEKNLGAFFFLKAVAPHAVFELPAIMLSAATGLRIGLSFLARDGRKRAGNVSAGIREAALIQILLATPLLLVAAFIEAYVSAELVR